MKKYIFIISCLFVALQTFAQEENIVKGVVMNDANDNLLENVNIVNLNQVIGTTTNENGEFAIKAAVNDTLYFSYLGFKSLRVRVTNDWLRFGDIKVKMTELGIALEEVVVKPVQLTGFLYNVFGKRPKQMRKLRQMKEDDEIRNLLQSKYDRETLMAVLQLERVDIDEILNKCSYSKDFIRTANDLQILDAISGCYEEYKILNRDK
jgi:hypothetical protein